MSAASTFGMPDKPDHEPHQDRNVSPCCAAKRKAVAGSAGCGTPAMESARIPAEAQTAAAAAPASESQAPGALRPDPSSWPSFRRANIGLAPMIRKGSLPMPKAGQTGARPIVPHVALRRNECRFCGVRRQHGVCDGSGTIRLVVRVSPAAARTREGRHRRVASANAVVARG